MARFLKVVGLILLGVFSIGNIQAKPPTTQVHCDSVDKKVSLLKDNRGFEKASTFAKLRSCFSEKSTLYEETYIFEIRAHYLSENYERAIRVEDNFESDPNTKSSLIKSYVHEYAGLSSFRMGNFRGAHYHLKSALRLSGERDLRDRLNLQRSLAINHAHAHSLEKAEAVITSALDQLQNAEELNLSNHRAAKLYLTASGIIYEKFFAVDFSEPPSDDVDFTRGRRYLARADSLMDSSSSSTLHESRILFLTHKAAFNLPRGRFDAAREDIQEAINLAKDHDYSWGLVHSYVARASLEARAERYRDGLTWLAKAYSEATDAEVNEIIPAILHHRVRIAAKADQRSIATTAMRKLSEMDIPSARYHGQKASLKYVTHFSESPQTQSWTLWASLVLASGLLVGGGVIAGRRLAGDAHPLAPYLDRQDSPEDSDRPSGASARDDSPGSASQDAEAFCPDSTSSPAIEHIPLDDPTASNASSEDRASDDNSPSSSESDDDARAPDSVPDGPDELVRLDPDDASPMARSPLLYGGTQMNGDSDGESVARMAEDGAERSDEHRRLLFGLWGIPPYGTEEKVGLPAYLADGTLAGYRAVSVDRIQRALHRRLFLRAAPRDEDAGGSAEDPPSSEPEMRLCLMLREPTTEALAPVDETSHENATRPTSLSSLIQAVELASVPGEDVSFE
jgi:hypothetical protein